MKKVLLFSLLSVGIFACSKKDNQSNTPANGSNTPTTPPVVTPSVSPTSDKPLSAQDSITAVNIRADYAAMRTCLDSMLATPHHSVKLHWDSLYHHHDSLFWHHHSAYHHDSATHDDHHHSWTHYDASINHAHHHHHVYSEAGHEHDSLVLVVSHHTHSNTDHHFSGHGGHDHHLIDSIHHVHVSHHP